MYKRLLNRYSDYGLGAETAEINDTNFSAVANTCDEDVSLSQWN